VYSPKIADDLIPTLYQMANQQSLPMTKVVDQLLRPQVIKTNQFQLNKHRRNSHGKNNAIPSNPNG